MCKCSTPGCPTSMFNMITPECPMSMCLLFTSGYPMLILWLHQPTAALSGHRPKPQRLRNLAIPFWKLSGCWIYNPSGQSRGNPNHPNQNKTVPNISWMSNDDVYGQDSLKVQCRCLPTYLSNVEVYSRICAKSMFTHQCRCLTSMSMFDPLVQQKNSFFLLSAIHHLGQTPA